VDWSGHSNLVLDRVAARDLGNHLEQELFEVMGGQTAPENDRSVVADAVDVSQGQIGAALQPEVERFFDLRAHHFVLRIPAENAGHGYLALGA
jgi:hypothetical protein